MPEVTPMLPQEFKPLLPRQRLAAGKAQIEMEVNAVLRRDVMGVATPAEVKVLRQALATLRGSKPC